MTTEQSGAPSASAGGAAAPHPHAVDNAVAGALTDQYGFLPLSVRYAAAEVARGIVERWQNEGVLDDTTALPTGALATQLHAIVEEWQKLVDAHPRLADLVQESAAVPDPRDAEIEQLCTALARYQKRLGDDLLCGGKLVERVRAALRVDNGSTCTRASMDGVAGDVGRLCDEIERLRADVLVVQQHLQRAHGQPDSCVTTEYMGPDFSRAMVDGLRDGKEKAEASLAVEQRNLLNEMDEHQTAQALLADAREEWKRADAEVTRLKRLVGNENVSYDGWYQLSRHDAIVRCEEGWQEYLKARDERDRLRQELDLIGAQQPKFQPGQRVRIGLCDGIVITPKDTTRVQFEGMLHTFDIPTRDVHAIDDIVPAEPRRWVAGDHEPAVGTEVTFGAGVSIWKRHSDDTWKSNSCQCKQCKSTTGLTWQDLIAYAPLVEVVTPDGD